MIGPIKLSHQEVAILLATRVSENALTCDELATVVENNFQNVQITLSHLVEKKILEDVENYDYNRVYIYASNDIAQDFYTRVHQGVL